MNPESNQHPQHRPTYRSPFLSPLTPPAAGGNGGGFGFGRNHHASLLSFSNAANANHMVHPYSPSSFRVGSGPPPQTQQRTPRLLNIGETPTSAAAASATKSVTEWDTQQVHVDLQTAGNILLQRQLKCSAKFVAELDIGLVHDVPHEEDVPANVGYKSTTISEDLFLPSRNYGSSSTNQKDKHSSTNIQYPSLFQYARTLVELGDYAYAATILSVSSSSRTASSAAASGTSKFTSTTTSSSLSPTVEVTATTSHCHHQLSFSQKPLPNLSSYEIYLRSYALYMAGEKQKEEQILEHQRYADESRSTHSQV